MERENPLKCIWNCNKWGGTPGDATYDWRAFVLSYLTFLVSIGCLVLWGKSPHA